MTAGSSSSRGPLFTGFGRALGRFLGRRSKAETPERIRQAVREGAIGLNEGLRQLREMATHVPLDGRLLEWERRWLHLPAADEAEWHARAWWGLWAGELLRDALHHRRRHADAMALVDSPPEADLARMIRPQGEARGAILVGAHVGPPHTALAWLLHRNLPLLAWTATSPNSFAWLVRLSAARMVNARAEPQSLTKAALHLRQGGVLFASVDGTTGGRSIPARECSWTTRFTRSVPTLARRMALPACLLLTLWERERISIVCQPLEAPDDRLDDDAWIGRWLDGVRQPIDDIVRRSPENLRFLLFLDNRAIGRELGL